MATTRRPTRAALEADVASAGGEVIEMDEALLAKITQDNPSRMRHSRNRTPAGCNRPESRADLAGGARPARSGQSGHHAATATLWVPAV
jgi:hypothetical protein